MTKLSSLLAPIWLLGSAVALAAPASAEMSQLAGDIDALFADATEGARPGYAVAIYREGNILFARGYGYANLDDRAPISPATVFHIASLSKQFTAAAVALLLLDERLSLDDPVARYIPEAAHFGPELQIKHLVYMTSGIPEYSSRPRPGGQPWFSSFYFTRDDALAAALSAPALDFQPGTRWAYSNVNYMLLTRIVEEVSGERFADFMAKRVFDPLEMDATRIDDDTTAVISHRAIGYAQRTGALALEAESIGVVIRAGKGWARMLRVSPHFGGSGVMTSLDDLAQWDANWTNPRLGEGFAELMERRMRFAHDKQDDAMGLVAGTFGGRRALWYAGGDLDGSSFMLRFPEQRLTFVCLSNVFQGDCEGRTMRLIQSIADKDLLGL